MSRYLLIYDNFVKKFYFEFIIVINYLFYNIIEYKNTCREFNSLLKHIYSENYIKYLFENWIKKNILV